MSTGTAEIRGPGNQEPLSEMERRTAMAAQAINTIVPALRSTYGDLALAGALITLYTNLCLSIGHRDGMEKMLRAVLARSAEMEAVITTAGEPMGHA